MKKKNKRDENQIWTMAMTILPVIMLMNVGKTLASNSGTEIIFAGVFGGLGAIIGFVVNHFTKEKRRRVKTIAMLGIMITCSIIVYFTLPKEEGMTITILS